jgi:predicted nucleotidyltransferase
VALLDLGRSTTAAFLPTRHAVPLYAILEAMDAQDVLTTLRRFEPDLRGRGVRRAALFGSVARGDHAPGSDIDIMIEIDPEARITVFDYAELKEYISSLFEGPVDVVSRDGLKPYVRPVATAGAIYAF